MSTHFSCRVLILGAGAAGLTAAIYAARAALSPIVVQGLQPGGQLTITTDVENYPGFAEIIQGPQLMEQMHKQAENVGARMVFDLISAVDFTRHPFQAYGDSGDRYSADAVILATGAQARWLDLPSEAHFKGFGVSACATCDGFFYRDKIVAVVGGGNAACEEALFLTHFAKQVIMIHRRDRLRGEKILHDRVFRNPKITILWNTVVDEILGHQGNGRDQLKGVSGIRLRHVQTSDVQDYVVDGIFIAIGHDPATLMFRGQVDLDEAGYVLTAPDSTATSIPGVFAAGDVKDKIFRQAVTAAGMGCMAALETERWLASQE